MCKNDVSEQNSTHSELRTVIDKWNVMKPEDFCRGK